YESLTDKDWRKIIPALSFIELSTVATYVLDDIIDNQPERQRNEATWKKYGINKGIIAGSLQTFLSLDSLNNLDINDSNKVRVLNLANNMWLKLWTGEGFNEEMKENTSFEEYINRSYNIAGIMFGTIAQITAICANASDEYLQIASNIGRNYGNASMARNDLIDLLPKFGESSKALSKKPHEDIEKGIWTYPVIHLMQNADEEDKKLVMALLGNKSDNSTYYLMESMLNKYGSINATLNLITEYKDRANSEIMKLPESKNRELLFELTGLLENLRGV
ncbi:MAG: polyprenyl synthetase family protein, partial [Nanoarchaeota archaeon]